MVVLSDTCCKENFPCAPRQLKASILAPQIKETDKKTDGSSELKLMSVNAATDTETDTDTETKMDGHSVNVP